MTETKSNHCGHDHVFLTTDMRANERRTRWVIGLTAGMMGLEVAGGLIFGSMALLADGWHMASHAAALGITAVGYSAARRYASDSRFCFGTGKVGELAAFSSALLLAFIALVMGYESVQRMLAPRPISFNEAIAVAVLGLIVNVVSALMLKEDHGHHHEHELEHDHGRHHSDHNLKAAYIHVLADALTSVLAIAALVAGRFLGWVWLDPVMGLVGAVVILRWSYSLSRDTGKVLLDMKPGRGLAGEIRRRIESEQGSQVGDLHVWQVGPGHYSAIVSLTAVTPRTPDHYKSLLAPLSDLCHVTVEVNPAEV